MSKGKQDIPDDRTILDPLNADELKALKEARARLKAAAKNKDAVGPDASDEDIGSAPTMAMPAIKADQVEESAPSHMPAPKPMTPENARISAPEKAQVPPAAGDAKIQQGGGAGKGFGDNTLMWMSPVEKREESVIPERGRAAASGMIPTQVPEETTGRKLTVFGLVAAIVVAVLAAGYVFFLGPGGQGVVELTTEPLKATVKIDGNEVPLPTPMKATLPAGSHSVEVSLDGYETESFTLNITDGSETQKKLVLTPVSEPGKYTVAISVKPIAANITLDDKTWSSKREIKVGNVDPAVGHKLVISAGGYQKIEHDIAPNKLQKSYNFMLQKEAE